MEFPKIETQPVAAATAIIQGSTYRISVLTERLLRLEYNENGHFEDRASQVVWNRAFPKVEFEVNETEEELDLETSFLHLHYDKKEFSANGLTIEVKGYGKDQARSWFFGKDPEHSGNLFGTARTLDMVNGSCELGLGLMSLEGWSVLDDSNTLLLDENGWVCPRTEKGLDFYFFGYQSDEKGCLRDYYHLTGKTPMLPRFALGNWWSRYYAYTEDSYKELVTRFEKEEIPFSVGVIDMDWHLVEDVDPKYGSGWTGYTWNKNYFPDPERFMTWLHDHGMRITLNLHPADGIRAYEEAYPAIAAELGNVDIANEAPVDFDITSKKFLEAYFKCVLHPEEEKGVDFWWIDWQQGSNCKIEGLDPLWIFNHFHFLDSARNGKRPMTFSRYAGPGSHRYPVGFSGDTHITWDSLDFQPYFTSTASNIGYGWWSHDIGGHMLGYKNDEMTARWTQYGIFSPIMRLHSSCSDFNGKEPWRFKKETEVVMEEALRERHRMMPYLYTMNYRSYQEDLPLVEPMYYEYPEAPEAYEVKNQYFFGDQLMVAAVTTPRVKDLNVAKTAVWLPDGVWYDLYTGLRYEGGRMVDMYRTLDSIPVLAKAGGILVMTDEIRGTEAEKNPESLNIRVFPGADGSFRLYEDDNETCAYENGACVFTEMDYKEKDQGVFTIHPAQGKTELIPAKRAYTVEFCNFAKTGTDTVKVLVNGAETEAAVKYEEKLQKICVEVEADTAAEVQIILAGEVADNRIEKRIFDFLNQAEIGFVLKDRLYQLITAGKNLPVLLSELQSMELDKDLYGALMEILTA